MAMSRCSTHKTRKRSDAFRLPSTLALVSLFLALQEDDRALHFLELLSGGHAHADLTRCCYLLRLSGVYSLELRTLYCGLCTVCNTRALHDNYTVCVMREKLN